MPDKLTNQPEKTTPPVELTDEEMEQASGGKFPATGGGNSQTQQCGNCGNSYTFYPDKSNPCPHCGN